MIVHGYRLCCRPSTGKHSAECQSVVEKRLAGHSRFPAMDDLQKSRPLLANLAMELSSQVLLLCVSEIYRPHLAPSTPAAVTCMPCQGGGGGGLVCFIFNGGHWNPCRGRSICMYVQTSALTIPRNMEQHGETVLSKLLAGPGKRCGKRTVQNSTHPLTYA